MSDVQTWLGQVSARLEAVKREPAQEERDYEVESQARSDLYQHAPTDLTQALASLQAVLDLHRPIEPRMWLYCAERGDTRARALGQTEERCEYCRGNYPCPTVLAIADALDRQEEK